MRPAIAFPFALFLLWLFLPSARAGSAAQSSHSFVVISDLHFNPLANSALVPRLINSPATKWEAIFTADSHPPVQHYNDDTSWPLFANFLSGVRGVQYQPRLIIVTGDILAHKLPEKFAAAGGPTDAASYRAFIQKTTAFIGLELQKVAAGAEVVYAVGNNDDECGDYALEPAGPFLHDTSDLTQSLAHLKPEAVESWIKLGSYAAANPLAKHHRILALNTTFWSRRYANTCGDKADVADPGAAVLNWLSTQLEDASRHRDKVWLVYHIPPGIDGHTSSRTGQVVPMWNAAYSDGFKRLLDQYRNTIELNLAGHTHLDDFRLVKTDNATTLVLMTPGVSPNVGQNPAFRIIHVDSQAQVNDISTYILPDLASAKWQLEYDTRAAFKLKHIDAKSYAELFREMQASPDLMAKWKQYYSVSRPGALNSSPAYQRSLFCATGNTEPAAFQACLGNQ